MKRLWLLGWLLLIPAAVAIGQIVPSLPVTLQNSTLADANQVMANFNAIVAGVNANAAKNGINTDITALQALSTPLTAAQGGSVFYYGGTSTGGGNAQSLATLVPAGYALAPGNKISFIAGASNTGAMTLTAGAALVKNVYRTVPAGLVPLAGGEVVAGMMVMVVYDGTQYQLSNSAIMQFPGMSVSYRGTSAPAGFALEDGSAVSRTTNAALFAVIGTTYGIGDGVTTFNLPDSRGRVDAGRDDMGGSAANRITNAGSGCVGTTLGLGCGSQSTVLDATMIPAHTHPSPTLTDPQHTHTSDANHWSNNAGGVSFGSGFLPSGATINAASTGITLSPTTGSTGGGLAHSNLNPALITNKIIRF